MDRHVALSSGFGEVMAPHTLVTALVVSPDGFVKLDPGALHSRSEVESALEFVKQRELVRNGAIWWVVWVAVELDASNRPLRYHGVSVSEMVIDAPASRGYKSLAEHVNRMSEAMRGGITLGTLKPEFRPSVKEQLFAVGGPLWEASSSQFTQVFDA